MSGNRASIKGQGAQSNASGRYEVLSKVSFDDGWHSHTEEGQSPAVRTQWRDDKSASVITRNKSPDVPFDRSINPYRGCEHGCIYCFARPTHTWLGHSAGLDFERLLYAKRDAATLLRKELAHPAYRCQPVALGVNTDAYQPLERSLGITRAVLEVLAECRHPVYLITKSSLIERDLDLLSRMAEDNLVTVTITITTLNNTLSSKLEPRATAPHRRLRTLQTLSGAGVPVRASISPIIPVLNEPEIESLVNAAAEAGAEEAHCILLRLPHELQTLFPEWLEAHYPLKAARILKAIASMRSGKLNNSTFGTRMSGEGPRADIIQQRFRKACASAGLGSRRTIGNLNTSLFIPPAASGQLSLDMF
ncbi:MAG: PA0069 family radical SAM protein [Granulosicoccus sp.]